MFAAHGHREELGQQRPGVVTHFPQPDRVSEKNWANDAKDTILKPNEAILFPYGLPCECEKSVQKAAVSMLLPTYSKLGLNSLTATNKTDIGNYFKAVFVHYADKGKTWKDSQTPISQFLGIV